MCERCPVLAKKVASVTADRDQLREERDALVSELTEAAKQKAALRAQLADRRASHKHAAEAREVYDHWKETLAPRSREFTGTRFDAVAARLNAGHTVEDCKRAVDGCAASRWHRENGKTDLELICRNEGKLLEFLAKAKTAEKAKAKEQRKEDVRRFGTDPWTNEVRFHNGGLENLLGALEGRGCTTRGNGGRWMAQCPAHEDRDPSLSIRETSSGAVLLHCFAGCETEDVIAGLGLEWRDLGPTENRDLSNTAELHEGWVA